MTEQTHESGRLRRALSRLTRAGDVPVVVMLAWAGWLAVPWSFSGLAQARAAAAAAADPSRLTQAAQEAAAHRTAQTLLPYGQAAAPPASGPLPSGELASARGPQHAGESASVRGPLRYYGEVFQQAGAAPTVFAPHDPVEARFSVERARIAGEVHDAAGHGLAAIALQAKLALLLLDEDPVQARASLEAIRDTSTEALGRLRAALDALDPGSASSGLEPDDLGRLIDGVRAAGLRVDVEPEPPSVPAHLQGAVFRVVRESLTNVLRHAGPTTASVRLAHDPRAFVLEVTNDTPAATHHGVTARGFGVVEGRGVKGMRAHVVAAGGDFTAGPRDGGGFRVVARFPQPDGVSKA